MTKILTVCQGGNVRSVGLAYLLKYATEPKMDAVALGWDGNTPETLATFCQWADAIVVMQGIFLEKLPRIYQPGQRAAAKAHVCDVGPDVFGNPLHRDLLARCTEWINAANLDEVLTLPNASLPRVRIFLDHLPTREEMEKGVDVDFLRLAREALHLIVHVEGGRVILEAGGVTGEGVPMGDGGALSIPAYQVPSERGARFTPGRPGA